MLPLRGCEVEFLVREDGAEQIGERSAVDLGELDLALGYARVEASLRDARDAIPLLGVEVDDDLTLEGSDLFESCDRARTSGGS